MPEWRDAATFPGAIAEPSIHTSPLSGRTRPATTRAKGGLARAVLTDNGVNPVCLQADVNVLKRSYLTEPNGQVAALQDRFMMARHCRRIWQSQSPLKLGIKRYFQGAVEDTCLCLLDSRPYLLRFRNDIGRALFLEHRRKRRSR